MSHLRVLCNLTGKRSVNWSCVYTTFLSLVVDGTLKMVSSIFGPILERKRKLKILFVMVEM
jgi:hypothetical protein